MSGVFSQGGWSTEKLASLVDVVYGKSPAEIDKLDAGLPIFGTGGVAGYTDKALYSGPSIILGRKGTIDKVQRSPGPFWAIDTTYYTTPKRAFDWSWLYYVISSFDLRKLNEASGVPSLSRSSLESLDVPTPPFEEQQKIAAILTAVDDKLDVIARQIEATQTLKQGLMQTLFSRGVGTQDADGRWVPHAEFKDCELGEIPAGWNTGELLNFLELQRGVDLPVQDRRAGQVPVFGSNGVLGFHDSSVCNGPGVITGRSGTIGKVFYTEALYWPLNTSLYVKDFKGNHPKFVYYKLVSIGLDKFSTGTGVPTLNRNVAHKEMVAFPSLNEQKEIAEILTCLDEKISVLGRRAESTQTLKRGLMQKLLTGEWRVKVDAELAA